MKNVLVQVENFFVMSNSNGIGNIKNFMCRDHYWQLINQHYNHSVFCSINGARLRKCTFGENCRGAHSENDIKILPANHQFNKLNKSKIDLIEIYNNICQVFETEKSKVLDPDFKIKIYNYSSFSFSELLNFWFDITCYHRRLKKNFDSEENEFYKNKNSIPDFFLEYEDIVWPLERITKMCPKHAALIHCIECSEKKPVVWDICCGSINCKEGCHHESNMICTDNLNTGICNCLTLEEFEAKKLKIKNEIDICNNFISDPEFKINSKKKKNITNKIQKLQKQYDSLYRKIHLTEEGLIPFEVALKIKKDIEEQKKKVETSSRESRETTLKTSVVKKKISKPSIKKI